MKRFVTLWLLLALCLTAALALFLASAQAAFITGQVICVDGGFAL